MSPTDRPDFSDVRGSVRSTEPLGDADQRQRKADFSDVQSNIDSTEEITASTAPSTPAPLLYTVEPGDTLSAIAQRHYGKASAWHGIFDANRDILDDPDRIQPGQVLRLPAPAD